MKKFSILFVDDEKMLVRSGSQILESMGYRVTPATGSMEALVYFQEQPQDFDLVITDFNMLQMNGGELAIKINSIRSDLPIILSTGCSNISREMVRMWGIDELIIKPYKLDEVRKLIEKVLQG